MIKSDSLTNLKITGVENSPLSSIALYSQSKSKLNMNLDEPDPVEQSHLRWHQPSGCPCLKTNRADGHLPRAWFALQKTFSSSSVTPWTCLEMNMCYNWCRSHKTESKRPVRKKVLLQRETTVVSMSAEAESTFISFHFDQLQRAER